MVSAFDDIESLAKLLEASEASADAVAEKAASAAAAGPVVTPATIGTTQRAAGAETAKPASKPKTKDIWDADEVPTSGAGVADPSDRRPRPEYAPPGVGSTRCSEVNFETTSGAYELLFKQKVSAQDVYFGLDDKNPSSDCCDALLLKVKLPGHKLSQLQLDVTQNAVDLGTPQYKLVLPLPRPVDHRNGSAEWDPDLCLLRVTMPLLPRDD